MTDPAKVMRWIGDDWSFPVSYFQPDGTTPYDLTSFTCGAVLFKRDQTEGISLVDPDGSCVILSPPTGGHLLATVAKTVTALVKPDPSESQSGVTRVQVFVLDASGKRTTIAVIPVWARPE